MKKKECLMAKDAPEAGLYSHAVKWGDLLFLSGQVSEDPKTGECIKDSVANQTRRILNNLKIVLDASGSGLDHVLKVTIFMTDINKKAELNEVYNEFFPADRPARIAVAVKALDENLDVEMDIIAGIPN